MSTVQRATGRGGILALALLLPLGAFAVVTEGPAVAAHRGAATVDRVGPRTATLVSARAPRGRMLPSHFATASLAAGAVLLGLALGGGVGRRTRGVLRAAGRSRAPPLPRVG